MKVHDIRSFMKFNKKKDEDEESGPSSAVVEVSSRMSKRKKKEDLNRSQSQEDISEEEEPVPKSVREKAKEKGKGESPKKRKARVLEESSDEEEELKPKSSSQQKKQRKSAPVVESSDEDGDRKAKEKEKKKLKERLEKEAKAKKKKEEEELEKKRKKEEEAKKAIDPNEFFAKGKVKDKRKHDGKEKKETPKPSTPTRTSPRKKVKEEPPAEPEPMTPVKARKVIEDQSKDSKKKEEKSKMKKIKAEVEDEEIEEDFNPKKSVKVKSSPGKAAPTKSPKKEKEEDKPTATSSKTPERAAGNKFNYAKYLSHLNAKPPRLGEKNIPDGDPQCLSGKTFVITGILDSLERDSAKDLIEKHSGRVTSAVSKKTTYLLTGNDPGDSKVRKAEQLGVQKISEDELLKMIRDSVKEQDRHEEKQEDEAMEIEESVESVPAEEVKPQKSPSPKKVTAAIAAVKRTKEEDKSSSSRTASPDKTKTKADDSKKESQEAPKPKDALTKTDAPAENKGEKFLMWVDKYKPTSLKQLVGQSKETSNAHKLVRWLSNWFKYHGNGVADKPKPAYGPFHTKDPEGKTYKCALLSGPPGIGKTTTAVLACKEAGYEYHELNASDTRNKKGLHQTVSSSLTNMTIYNSLSDLTSKHVLIMDEVDGMSGNEDRGGVQEVIALIKASKVPIICICNDRNHQKIRSLANYCFDLRFNKPTVQELKGFISSLCFKEKMKMDPQKMTQLIISTDQDVRQILHQMELYKGSNTADSVLKPRKDLRFGPWDVCRKVFYKQEHEGMNIHEKCSLFFQDYSIGPLFVQENYARWRPNTSDRCQRLDRIAQSAAAIAWGDMASNIIRGSNNWSLLPIQAVFSSYIPGELMESETIGNIEFPQWLGKNSNKNKRHRLLQSLHNHMHLSISGSQEALNLDYLPYLKRKIFTSFVAGDVEAASEVMESHSLVRDDLEAILDLTLWPGQKSPMERIDSKTKAAFTRMVNKEVLPYSVEKISVGRKRGKTEMDYGDEEEEEISEEEEAPEKDAMIKMKTSKKGGGESKGKAAAGTSKKRGKK